MIHLPANLLRIEDEAFKGCSSLTGPIVGAPKLQDIGKEVFTGTNLAEREEETNGNGE